MVTLITINCAYCNKGMEKALGHVNYCRKKGLNLYCDRKCAGLGRRSTLSIEEKKTLKAAYDKVYAKQDKVKQKKKEYFQRTYNPVQAAIKRKANMHKHIEIMRRPKWVAYKQEYDRKRQAKKQYGEHWESALLIREIEAEYDAREIRQLNNLHNKSQKRKRAWKRQNQNYLPKT